MTLPAFVAERRAAALLLLDAWRPPLSIDISCPHGAQQQTRLAPLLQSNMALSTFAAKLYFLIQMLQAASGKIMRLQQRRAAES